MIFTATIIQMKAQAYLNWSGGKDSALSLYRVCRSGKYEITDLLTSVIATENRVSMHGVRRSLLQLQSQALGLPLTTVELPANPDNHSYEMQMKMAIHKLKNNGCTHAIFGDIFLQDLREYREKKLEEENVGCVFPLWGNDSRALMMEFIQAGFRAVIVCVNEKFLDRSFCGRELDLSLINDLPPNVDPCGENGEYHSFVFDGPVFSRPVSFTKGDITYRKYPSPHQDLQGTAFFYLDLVARS